MTQQQVYSMNAPDPQSVLCERLLKAIDQAAVRDATSMTVLQDAVANFTTALRDRDVGSSPEAVLISLKAVINNRVVVDGSPYATDWTGRLLREKISSWCIEEFFRQKTA